MHPLRNPSRNPLRLLLGMSFLFILSCDDAPYYVREERERELARSRAKPDPVAPACTPSGPVSIAGKLVHHPRIKAPVTPGAHLEVLPRLAYPVDAAFSLCSVKEVVVPNAMADLGANHNLLARQLLLCGRRNDGGLIIRAEHLVLSNFVYQGFDLSSVKIYAHHLTLIGSNLIASRGSLKFHVSESITGPGRLTIQAQENHCP